MRKSFTKVICYMLATVLALGSSFTTFAEECEKEKMVEAPVSYRTSSTWQRNVVRNQQMTSENGLEIIEEITDPEIILQMVNDGLAERDEKGNLPTCITTYFAPDSTSESEVVDQNEGISLLGASGISVTKTNYYDGQYFDEYDRYVVDGPAEFSTEYSKKGSTNWNTTMTSDVSVGGSVFDLADLKTAVSQKVGYSFGVETTKKQTYTVDIPSGKYWEIKVWVSYLVYEYSAKVNSTEIASGKTWKPNGLVIKKTEYNQ